MVVGSGHVHFT